MGLVTFENVTDICSYHAPDADGLAKIQRIRDATEAFITTILENAPTCADSSAAIRHAREAMMSANAAIVLQGKI